MKLHGCTQHYIKCLLAESTVHDMDNDNQKVTLGVRTLTVSVLILTYTFYITHLVHLKPQTDRRGVYCCPENQRKILHLTFPNLDHMTERNNLLKANTSALITRHESEHFFFF